MAKKFIKATDKILTRYSKEGLQQINLEKKEIKNITSKIQDVSFRRNTDFDNGNSRYGQAYQESKSTRNKKAYANLNSANINTSSDMAYDKKNLDNMYDTGAFRNDNKTFTRSEISSSASYINNSQKSNSSNNTNSTAKHKKYSSGFQGTSQLRHDSRSNKVNFKSENEKLRQGAQTSYKQDNTASTLNFEKNDLRTSAVSSLNYSQKSNSRLNFSKEESTTHQKNSKYSKVTYRNKNNISRFKLNKLDQNLRYADVLIMEDSVKSANTRLRLDGNNHSKTLRHKIGTGVVNSLDTGDKTDVSNDVIKITSGVNLKRKQLIRGYKVAKTGVFNLYTNHKIKKEKNKIYQRLKFDKDDMKFAKKQNKNKLTDKSIIAGGIVSRLKHINSTAISKGVNSLETSDKTDVSNTLIKDSRRIKGVFSDVRQGFQTKKTKNLLSSKTSALKESRNILKYKTKDKIKPLDKLKSQKKFIKKGYGKKKFRDMQKKKLSHRIAMMPVSAVKSIAALGQRAVTSVLTAILSTIAMPFAIIASIVLVVGLFFAVTFGAYAQVFLYTYQAKDKDITNVNQNFTKKELELEKAAYDPPKGYDEYEYRIDPLEHNMDDLPSYFSLKHYKKGFTESSVAKELDELFNDTYTMKRWVREETRKRYVTKIKRVKRNGVYEDVTYTVEEEYTVEILVTELRNHGLENAIKARLTPEQQSDFKHFKETKGFFALLTSPVDKDYKEIVSKVFGYQFELNSKEKIEFLNYMELDTKKNDKVYAMIDGKISQKGDYVEIKTKEGNRIRYYNVVLVDTVKEVKQKDLIGVVSEEKVNGFKTSRMRIQILDKHGNYLDPYYYIESKIEGSPRVNRYTNLPHIDLSSITPTGSGSGAVELAKTFVGYQGSYMFPNFITPVTGPDHTNEEWCADFCAAVIATSIGGKIQGNTIYDKNGKPFMHWSAAVATWKSYAESSGLLHKPGDSYRPKPGDLILSDGHHIEIIASVDPLVTISGNSGSLDNYKSMVKIKNPGTVENWIKSNRMWTYGNTYIISVPYAEP